MGLFSNLRKAQTAPNHEATARAVMTPAVFVMTVDGSIDKSEIVQLGNVCSFSPIFAPVSGERLVQMIEEIINDISARSPNVVIREAIGAMSPGLRETSLAMAMRIALADGRLDEAEKNTLVLLSQDMGISQQATEVMFHVVGILQRGPDA